MRSLIPQTFALISEDIYYDIFTVVKTMLVVSKYSSALATVICFWQGIIGRDELKRESWFINRIETKQMQSRNLEPCRTGKANCCYLPKKKRWDFRGSGKRSSESSYINICSTPNSGLPQWLSSKGSACNIGATRGMGSILGWEDPLEEGMAAHSSILAWRIPWTEEPGGL